jgi:G3E family GTPase
MEWDPEILARLRSSREEVILRRKEIVRRKERNTSARAVSQTNSPEIKMVVGDWCTDQLGNRSRMVYNTKTEDIEAIYALSRKVSAS